MRGFIEIKEDSYEDMIEHLHKLKSITCKMIKKLEQYTEEEEEEEEPKKKRNRYDY